MADDPAPLDDPTYAKFAWGRFKRLLAWMGLVSVACGGIAVWLLQHYTGIMPIHMAIASFLGVTLTIFLAAALMGLIFLSSGSGHDEEVDRFNRDR